MEKNRENYIDLYGKYGGKIWDVLQEEIEVDGKIEKVIDTDFIDEFLLDEHYDLISHLDAQLYRLQNFYRIVTKESTLIKFKLNEAQFDFYTRYIMKGYLRLILVKSRQLGFTTFITIYFLDEVLFGKNTEALQIAHTKEDMSDIFQNKIMTAYENMPESLKSRLKVVESNKTKLVVKNGTSKGRIMVKNSGRGFTNTLVHISELAKLYIKKPKETPEIVTGTFQSVPMNGRIVIESTAEGAAGLFYDMYMASYNRRDVITPIMTKAEFYPVFYNWTWDKKEITNACKDGIIPISSMEKADIDWEQFQYDNNLSDEEMTYYYIKYIQNGRDVFRLKQEFPTDELEAFQASGSPYFSKRRISEWLNWNKTQEKYNRFDYLEDTKEFVPSYVEEVLDWDKFEGFLEFERPDKYQEYVVGVDIAEGLEHGDYSTCVVIGLDKKIKALYRGKISLPSLPELVVEIASRYNDALVVPETNKDTWVAINLNEIYENVYTSIQEDDLTKVTTRKIGWRTTQSTRMLALTEMSKYFNDGFWFPTSILKEMHTFVRDEKGRPAALSGKHDDLIMACAIAYGGSLNKKAKPIEQMKEENSLIRKLFDN